MSNGRRHGEIGGVYLGLSVHVDKAVEHQRSVLCERYQLAPRSELHITVGYVGRIRHRTLARLTEFMRGAKHTFPQTLTMDVIGIAAGARVDDCDIECFGDDDFERHRRSPRVAWWVVAGSGVVQRLRFRLHEALISCGRFSRDPGNGNLHVTLGTAEDDPVFEVSRWMCGDSIAIPNPGIAGPHPAAVVVDRLHFTNGAARPEGLSTIWTFRTPEDAHISTVTAV